MKHLNALLWLLCCSSFLAYSQKDWQWIKRGGAGNSFANVWCVDVVITNEAGSCWYKFYYDTQS